MTTAVFRGVPYGGTVGRRGPTFGASQIAGRLLQQAAQFVEDTARSALGGTRWNDPLARLVESYEESRTLAGRGDYELPSLAAIDEAIALIASLPSWMPMPTPLMEPNGAIGLEWDFGPGRFFVLAVDGTGRIEYSAILGFGDEHHGIANFSGAMPRHAQTLLFELLRA